MSATEVDDDVHQWRVYGDHGTGYALGFDCDQALLPAANPITGSNVDAHFDSTRVSRWHHVMYDEAEVRLALEELLDAARSLWSDLQQDSGVTEPKLMRALFGKEVFSRLAEIAHLCKHSGFTGEREVRLVVSRPAADHIRYRVGQQGLLAYVTLAAQASPPPRTRPHRPGTVNLPPTIQLPIIKVVAGPRQVPYGDGIQANHRISRLHDYLERQGIENVEVIISDVPMR